MLNLSEVSGILRSRPARLDSPSSNRYAGDWTACGENYFVSPKEALSEADYDDVPSEEAESGDDGSKADASRTLLRRPICVSKERTFQAYLTMQTMDSAVNHQVNLKNLQESIDTLIGNLERELNKNKLNMSCWSLCFAMSPVLYVPSVVFHQESIRKRMCFGWGVVCIIIALGNVGDHCVS